MVFSDSWILPLKVFLISTGVLSIALFCKTSVPFVMDFSVSRAPLLWSSFVSWLKPPYIYLIINGIIIIIAASSRLYQNDHVASISTGSTPTPAPLPSDVEDEMKVKSDFANVVYEQQQMQMQMIVEEEEETKAPVFEEKSVVLSGGANVEVNNYGDSAAWTSPKRTDSLESVLAELDFVPEKERPLVSARFGHRKSVKASPEGGRKLRVTKPKRDGTLENTWKTITEGRAMPLTRHSKKSDTWENHNGRDINVDLSSVKKSETFNDRTNYQLPPVNNSAGSASAGKLKKEPSLSQDELNRRVEAFIKKFNDDMRLQRQESLRQYQEMISRGV